ncbi:MAG: peptide-methionine (S)-S-oxide reductase MsrA [Burkholderiales bacterium]
MTTHPADRTRRALSLGGALALAALATTRFSPSAAAEVAIKIPAPGADLVTEASGSQEVAVFAGGCFWGVQGVFQHTKGVIQAVSGYAGGAKQTAVYEVVGSGLTGHAEAVQITFDPKQITYAQLLQIYFSVAHDPTQLNRQFPDSGTQYRSAVFPTSASQKTVTEKYIAQLDAAKVFPAKIVTQVTPAMTFYPAEAYHQDYATLHPESGYIARFDLPKIANLKTTFPQLWREQPVLVMAKRS